jgi:hypothetical protein
MSYIVTTTSGTALATVPDNTVNIASTSITLVGKNYAGYGVFLNENYVKILENFSNTTAPNAPLRGQLWHDSNNSLIKVWTGSQWKNVGGSAAQSSTPISPVAGDLWWDTGALLLKVWGGSSWISIGPSASTTTGSASTSTGPIVETIIDNTTLSHIVITFKLVNQIIGIVSRDATFTPITPIPGFAVIHPGINLISSSTLTGSQFTGTATNALAVNNISSGSFLRSDQDSNNGIHTLTAGKIQVGSELLIDPTTASEVQIYSNGGFKDLNLYVKRSGVQTKAIGITANTAAVTFANSISVNGVNTTGTAIINGNTDGLGNIGSVSQRFNTVFARATSAQYADLAERFAADAVYAPGTVVELGGEQEITAVKDDLSDLVFGVISTNPAYLMNGNSGSNDTHPPVALSGRVPVRVIGTARKGDRLVSAGNGLARAANNGEISPLNTIGRCLADKYYSEEGSIEAVVRLNI